MEDPLIRSGEASDLPDLVRIYNHYVIETPITFDTDVFDVAGRSGWFEAFTDSGPHRLLVAEQQGRAIGYASSREFRSKPAYSRSVETTIYLDPTCLGRGLGRSLYRRLLDVLRSEQLVHRAYAGIALPNPQSIALHEELGFSLSGTFREVGFKFDRYWDVSWYEKDLEERSSE